MKIFYIALSENFAQRDAGFTHAISICRALNREHSITLAIGRRKNDTENESEFEVIELFTQRVLDTIKRPLTAFREIRNLRKLAKECDLIHERYSVNPLTLFLTAGINTKKVLEVNDPGIETWHGLRKILYAPLIKFKLGRCDAIITQTETLAGIIRKQTKKPVFVVSNGADPEKFNSVQEKQIAQTRDSLGLGKNEIAVGFVGSFREWHLDPGFILGACEFTKKIPNVKFVLSGEGKTLREIKKIVKSKNAGENFIFTGALKFEDVPKTIKSFDVCIAPFSTKEFKQLERHGFWWSPLKLYEYIAAGKPVVSFDFEEVEKILQGSGMLAEKENYEQFFWNIEQLALDEKLRETMGREALHTAKTNSWEQRAEETTEVYGKV